jgi:hypothetical protein
VDMFLFSLAYQDVVSLGANLHFKLNCSLTLPRAVACLPHYISGQNFFYSVVNGSDSEYAIDFMHGFGEVLAMPVKLEATTGI